MFPRQLLSFVSAAVPLAAALELCGMKSPTTDQIARTASIDALDIDFTSDVDTNGVREMFPIDVYLHVANMANGTRDVDEDALQLQFSMLQETYAPYGFDFQLKGMDFEVNNTISDPQTGNITIPPIRTEGIDIVGSTPAVEDWWKRKRQGGYDSLNIYFYYSIGGYSGLTSFPNPNRTAEKDWWLDGLHLYGGSLNGVPGGDDGMDNGGTLLHETGHWFGLYHTFQDTWSQGDCDGKNDLVADTPASMSAQPNECTGKENTCPDQPGYDPVFNYMNYVGDRCWDRLTEGQIARAHKQFAAIRRPA